MKKTLIKIFAPLLVVLLAVSFFGAFSASAAGQTTSQDSALVPEPAKGSNTSPLDAGQTVVAQEKAMTIITNVMAVDLSKYTIELQINSIMDGIPLANDNRKITNLMYALTPTESNDQDSVVEVYFTIENDIVTSYFIIPVDSQVITTKQYANQYEAVRGFLEKYQEVTKIDSGNLMVILNNVDLSKNFTLIKGNTKLAVLANSFFGVEQATLRWTYTVNGADYTALEISVNACGFVISVYDTRALYTIGDTSINVSKEKAIDIALENLRNYSYDMPDGSVVKDFKVSKDNIVATLVTSPVDYALQPYWDIRMPLDEVYPGNVQGVTAFIWANTGEVISYSNMAFGGTVYPDNANPSDFELQSTAPKYTLMAVMAAIIAGVIVVSAIGVMITKRNK